MDACCKKEETDDGQRLFYFSALLFSESEFRVSAMLTSRQLFVY